MNSIVAIVYCTTVGMAMFTSSTFEFGRCNQPVEQGLISAFVPEFSQFLNRSNQVVVSDQQNQFQSLNKPFSEYTAINQVFQLRLTFCLLQYNKLLKLICINSRKADGIFPFHYFW
jgi:hypothetical protein